jgi:hypothetical protein
MKRHLLLALALTTVLLLAVLFIRPPAWATPGQSAKRFQPHAIAPSAAHAPASSARPITLQADAPSSENCIACHTDKKKLKKLAKEPEEVKSEAASGEG